MQSFKKILEPHFVHPILILHNQSHAKEGGEMIQTDELVSKPKTKIETQDTQDFKDEEHYEFEYADIDLSEEFLSRILKQVDELCDAIQNGDPSLGAKYLVFVSSRSVKMRNFSGFSVCILFEKSVLIFQSLNIKMHNYALFDIIVHFIIQKSQLCFV